MLNIYRASAGSGKTYRLTEDYIHLLFDRDRDRVHRRILAVTFTNKATDEMKARILKELYALSIGEDSPYRSGLIKKFGMSEDEVNDKARKILVALLHDYSSFSISTIDRFFQQVIRSFAREIGVHGGYNLELDSDSTLIQSVDNMFLELSKEENRQLLNWLTQFAEDRIEQSENWNPRRNIEDLGKEVFKENYQHKAEDVNKKLHDREFLQNYRRELRTIQIEFEAKIQSLAHQGIDILNKHNLTYADFSYSATKDYDKLLSGSLEIGKRFAALAESSENCYGKKTPQHIINAIETAYFSGLQVNISEIVQQLSTGIIPYNSAGIILKHINTLGILSDLAMQIKKLTDEQNTMLISDANMLLNRIIDNSETPFVYEKTGIHIDHFMIDEFQDTSTLQWKNFYPLISNSLASGKFNLVVGDVKQSIYRWRNSDWKLLDQQIQKDFRPEQVNEENLDTNWRSDKNIVDFNNEFFRIAAQLLQQKLNVGLEQVIPAYPHLAELTQRIEHAYGQVFQKKATKAGEGYVSFNFIFSEDTEEKWKDESLNRLPALLEDVQNRGYKPEDVAVLVRTNGEARDVIQKLLNYKNSTDAKENFSYDIMGVEGMPVSHASSVRFIVGILKLMVQPDDTIQQTIVNFEYARAVLHLPEIEALNACFVKSKNHYHLFGEEEKTQLATLRNFSLYDMVEKIISIFGVGNWANEAVFIQAFQDVVYKYTSTKNSDLYSFLDWWEKYGAKQSVSTPDSLNAFRVMTIHKSKGLDFKVVIIPFCDWKMDAKSGFLKNIIWCEPKEEPFSQLPLIPVEYSSKLGQSVFAADYYDELMHQFIDNLNVAYVAFTRSVNELHCVLPKPEKNPESPEKINSLGSLLYYVFNNDFEEENIHLSKCFNSDDLKFESGKPTTAVKTTGNFPMNKKTMIIPSVSSSSKLQIKHQSLDFYLDNQQLTDSRLNYGLIMHEILQNIRYKKDEETAIESMVNEGRISRPESEIITQKFNDFWSIPLVADWFSEDKKVLNEASILTPNGDIYRPDRVVLSGEKAIVIDYKFGDAEMEKYHRQVKQYMELISGMGYQVKGYLCYVSLEKVVEIN
jgi:ATP-dependent helicase/nuclease subunit A